MTCLLKASGKSLCLQNMKIAFSWSNYVSWTPMYDFSSCLSINILLRENNTKKINTVWCVQNRSRFLEKTWILSYFNFPVLWWYFQILIMVCFGMVYISVKYLIIIFCLTLKYVSESKQKYLTIWQLNSFFFITCVQTEPWHIWFSSQLLFYAQTTFDTGAYEMERF